MNESEAIINPERNPLIYDKRMKLIFLQLKQELEQSMSVSTEIHEKLEQAHTAESLTKIMLESQTDLIYRCIEIITRLTTMTHKGNHMHDSTSRS